MTVRGGGVPAKATALMPSATALMPSVRMGPPPRSFRCDAHHCIMVWVLTHRIQGCDTNVRATTRGLPSNVVIPTTTSVPSCSNPSRTKPLRVALRAILDRFCARRLYAIVGRDEETACQVEQRNWSRNKWIGPPGTPLTKITPYKVFRRLDEDLPGVSEQFPPVRLQHNL